MKLLVRKIFSILQVGPKKAPYFGFHPKVVIYNVFPNFPGGVDSRLGRFFWHQYGSKWTLYYAAADKNHLRVLCRKISSSDTAAIQEKFGHEPYIWWKGNSTFGGQISEDRKCGRCSLRPRSFIIRHNSWEYSEFTGTPWGFPRKSTRRPPQETGISRTSVLRILHDDLKDTHTEKAP